MNRRSFLQALAIGGIAAVVPAARAMALPSKRDEFTAQFLDAIKGSIAVAFWRESRPQRGTAIHTEHRFYSGRPNWGPMNEQVLRAIHGRRVLELEVATELDMVDLRHLGDLGEYVPTNGYIHTIKAVWQ